VVPDQPLTDDEKQDVKQKIIAAIKTVYDPEIPVDIWELGLVYGVEVAQDRTVEIRMTLTSPSCPSAQTLPVEVEQRSAEVEGVRSAMVDVVWEPPWGPHLMSDVAKLELNID
jgi:FeS assembly SUF system protein